MECFNEGDSLTVQVIWAFSTEIITFNVNQLQSGYLLYKERLWYEK